MENGNEMIRIEHLRKRYGDLQVLDDINLTIKRGEKLVILGPSGSGREYLDPVHQSSGETYQWRNLYWRRTGNSEELDSDVQRSHGNGIPAIQSIPT